jgi:hypothetical protein
LAPNRTSCTKNTANQFRLLIHTATYWLMLSLRGLAPRTSFWRDAQFDTIRLCLIKIAARVTEMVTPASRSPCRPATLTRSASPCSPAASPSCRRERRGGVPQTNPSAQPQTPISRVLDATQNHVLMPPSRHNPERRVNDSG